MGQAKHYDREYKEEAIKLAEEKGCKKASEELGIFYYMLYDWIKQARQGNLHLEKRSESNVSKLEDECNDTYGKVRMHEALMSKHPDGRGVPSESTVYRVMNAIYITHRPKRKPSPVESNDLAVLYELLEQP